MPAATAQKVRFGPFELDRQSAELSKLGLKLKLQGQPIAVLSLLLDRSGELVTREELRQHLWPEDTFVDFEHSLNTDIKKLRQALDDDADTPRYIETLPRRGYRFIAKVEAVPSVADPLAEPAKDLKAPSSELPTPGLTPPPEPPPARKPGRWKFVAATVLLLAIAGGAVYWDFRPRRPVVTAFHQLTHTGNRKGGEGLQVVTDGTRIYFDDFVGGKWKIAQVSTKGGDVSYLDIPFAGVRYGSTDGSELLATMTEKGGTWLIHMPNGPSRKVLSEPGNFVVFVPTRNQLFYIPATDPKRLAYADLEGGKPHLLLSTPNDIQDFSVSPDGKTIRFTMRYQLWESAVGSPEFHRLFPEHQMPVCCGNWSPDGRTFTFNSAEWEVTSLWTATRSMLTGRELPPLQLTFGPTSFIPISTFSPNGKEIFAVVLERGDLLVHDAASGRFQPYLNGISAGFLDFSRDGQWVAYVIYREGFLWRSRIDGSERVQLTFRPMSIIVNPRWSPDGRLIVFTEWGFPGNRIYVIPADGGSPMLLVSDDVQPADPTWSPDGKSIVYGGATKSAAAPVMDIRMMNLETRKSETIPGSQHKYSPRWSPDGRFIAALAYDNTRVFLYSFETGHWKEIWSSKAAASAGATGGLGWPSWSHDSQFLYVMNDKDIYKIRVSDGRAALEAQIVGFETTCPMFYEGWFGLTPDDRILVLRDRGMNEVYALDLEYR